MDRIVLLAVLLASAVVFTATNASITYDDTAYENVSSESDESGGSGSASSKSGGSGSASSNSGGYSGSGGSSAKSSGSGSASSNSGGSGSASSNSGGSGSASSNSGGSGSASSNSGGSGSASSKSGGSGSASSNSGKSGSASSKSSESGSASSKSSESGSASSSSGGSSGSGGSSAKSSGSGSSSSKKTIIGLPVPSCIRRCGSKKGSKPKHSIPGYPSSCGCKGCETNNTCCDDYYLNCALPTLTGITDLLIGDSTTLRCEIPNLPDDCIVTYKFLRDGQFAAYGESQTFNVNNVTLDDDGAVFLCIVFVQGTKSRRSNKLILNVTDENDCESDPCQNGGTCRDLLDEYQCDCVPGYTGVNCELFQLIPAELTIAPVPVEDGSDFTLTCDDQGNDATSFTFQGGNVLVVQATNTLTLTADIEDDTIYTCTYTVDGLSPPSDSNPVQPTVIPATPVLKTLQDICTVTQNGNPTIYGGDDIVITCTSDPAPPAGATYQFYLNGDLVQESTDTVYQITGANTSQGGDYHCLVVYNGVESEDSNTITLTVLCPEVDGSNCRNEVTYTNQYGCADLNCTDECECVNYGTCCQHTHFYHPRHDCALANNYSETSSFYLEHYTYQYYTCLCKAAFTGEFCETNIDDCASHPCQNGATCYDNFNFYVCICAYGWTGVNCETGKYQAPTADTEVKDEDTYPIS